MKNPKLELSVRYASEEEPPSRYYIKRWVIATLGGSQCKKMADISIRFVTEKEGLSFNERFRQKQKATNVLAFNYSTDDLILGDMIICCPVVIAEATRYRIALQHRYAHMVVHGTLHLLGFTHDAPHTTQAMEKMEESVFSVLKFPSPYNLQ